MRWCRSHFCHEGLHFKINPVKGLLVFAWTSVLEQKKKSAVQSKMTLKGMLGQRLGCRTSRLRSKFIWSAVSMPWIMAAPLPYRRRISDVRLDPGRSVGAAAVLSFWSPLTERKHKSTEFILKIKVCESVRPCPLISVGWFLNEWANHWYREKKKNPPSCQTRVNSW